MMFICSFRIIECSILGNYSYFIQMWWLKFFVAIGLVILLMLYSLQRSRFILSNNSAHSFPSAHNLSTQPQSTDRTTTSQNMDRIVPSNNVGTTCTCPNNETVVLEKCSESTFVTSRAKKRIEADKNAIFLNGDRVIDLGQNYFVSVDDILYGYDILFETDALYTAGSWLGAQFQASPHDAMVLQQLIWRIKPDLIIDLGTNVGGSALFFASIMSFYSDTGVVVTVDAKPFTDNWIGKDRVICKDCINPSEHKLWKKYVQFIQGLTTDLHVLTKVKEYVSNSTTIFVSQDASHDFEVVYQDLLNYAGFVSVNSYLVVQDTKLERIKSPKEGPLTAIKKFLQYQSEPQNSVKYKFQVDRSAEVFYYSQHAFGWLKRVS